jgi:hypothetical protein
MAHIQPTSIPIQRMLRPRSFLPVGPEKLDDDPIALTACTAFNLLPMFHLVSPLSRQQSSFWRRSVFSGYRIRVDNCCFSGLSRVSGASALNQPRKIRQAKEQAGMLPRQGWPAPLLILGPFRIQSLCVIDPHRKRGDSTEMIRDQRRLRCTLHSLNT